MASILYVSVHEALEYAEVTLLQELGHVVFPLGAYSPFHKARNPFRPAVTLSPLAEVISDRFQSTSSSFEFLRAGEAQLSPGFLDLFDIIIVMHDIRFIANNWRQLRGRNVVWRTIGQAIDDYEAGAKALRSEGLKIVRWSPREIVSNQYLGHDAIIRGHTHKRRYRGWLGDVHSPGLTFSNAYRVRYPIEYRFAEEALEGIEYRIGGGANDSAFAIGIVDYERQPDEYRRAGFYFYFHGTEVPYTLNFVEAWMTGVPLIAISRENSLQTLDTRFNEVDDLIVHDENGFLVGSVHEVRATIEYIRSDAGHAQLVGARGRRSAVALFSRERASQDWGSFLAAYV